MFNLSCSLYNPKHRHPAATKSAHTLHDWYALHQRYSTTGDRTNREWRMLYLSTKKMQTMQLITYHTTYIGNRVNILFEGASSTYFHLQHIKYFVHMLPDSNQLLQAVSEDASDRVVEAELQALCITHKIITEPFWTAVKMQKMSRV